MAGLWGACTASGGRETARPPRAAWRRDQHRGQKRGDGIGYAGPKPHKGETVIAIIDHHGAVLAPVPGAPVHATAMVRLPQGLHALQQLAKEGGVDLRGADLNLDGGFDAAHKRKGSFKTGRLPNIPENSRHRKRPIRGRKRLFNAAMHTLRMRVERTLAWADQCKRLRLRFARIQRRHDGMKLLGYTLINLRQFCGT